MRKLIPFLLITLILFISSCSKEEKVTPHDRFDLYIKQWQELEFTKMYDLISTESKEEYQPDEIIDRYHKIYEDLNISDLEVSYNQLSEEQLDTAMEKGIATIPFSVTMESIAGPINFEYEVTLIQEGKEKEEQDWFISWDAGFIFPSLKDGGEIRFQTTPPMRGEILDRNKMPLAINDYVFEVGIVPGKLEENPEQQKEQISQLLNTSVDVIDSELSASWVEPDLFVPIKKIPKTEESIIDELQEIDAIMIRDDVIGRVYPLEESAAHLIGYIGPISAEELEEKEPGEYGPNDLIGKRGLEQLYENRLKGKKGIKILVIHDDGSEEILAEQPVTDGENISLTIDVNIQEKIYHSYEDNAGTATAINPKTGETLALVSSPSFDPNEFLYGISQSRLDELENDPQSPFINRFTATFAPGSVIKPITAAIGLEHGTIDPDEGLEIKGLTWDNGDGWGDYQVRRVSETNEPVDLADALIRSDNIYFAMQSIEIGNQAFMDGLEKFGFSSDKLPFEYPVMNSTISSSGTLKGEVQLANTSYGQAEIEVSALHLATAYTTFLNKGNMLKPTLLTTEDTGQIWKEKLISSDDAELIRKILRDVVLKGTATVAKNDDLAISGKTGTAELKHSLESEGHENGWFVGYPTDDEDLLIAMMIEHVEDIGTSSFVAEKVADLLIEIGK